MDNAELNKEEMEAINKESQSPTTHLVEVPESKFDSPEPISIELTNIPAVATLKSTLHESFGGSARDESLSRRNMEASLKPADSRNN